MNISAISPLISLKPRMASAWSHFPWLIYIDVVCKLSSEYLVYLALSNLVHLWDLIQNPVYGGNEKESSKGGRDIS